MKLLQKYKHINFRNLMMIAIKLFSICSLLLIMACSNNSKKKERDKDNQSEEELYNNPEITIKTFKTDTLGWGYNIYINKSLYIHQPHIPAINGNKGFKNETDAHIVAVFVASKIHENSMPPSVKVSELDSLGVLK